MKLHGMLSTLPDGSIGFDCNQVLTESQVKQFAADGMKFVMRYVGRINRADHDLSRDEAQLILDNNLAVGIVQHVAGEGWSAFASKGYDYGLNAATFVLGMGFPQGMHVWCDLEGINPTENKGNVIKYCEEWYRAVDSANLNPGLYCGWHTLLNGTQIGNLPFKSYWSAYNLNKDEFPPRGVQIRQANEKVKYNVRYDPDTTSADKFGDRPWFYCPFPK